MAKKTSPETQNGSEIAAVAVPLKAKLALPVDSRQAIVAASAPKAVQVAREWAANPDPETLLASITSILKFSLTEGHERDIIYEDEGRMVMGWKAIFACIPWYADSLEHVPAKDRRTVSKRISGLNMGSAPRYTMGFAEFTVAFAEFIRLTGFCPREGELAVRSDKNKKR